MLISVVLDKSNSRTLVSRFYIDELYIVDLWRGKKNKRVKSKFLSECPDFSCSRSDGTLEPVTSSSPSAGEHRARKTSFIAFYRKKRLCLQGASE